MFALGRRLNSRLRLPAVPVRAVVLLPFLVLFLAPGGASSLHSSRTAAHIVPLCRGIDFSASYLAQAGAGQGPAFEFRLTNRTAAAIRLREPVPSSSHWFAWSGQRWMWRASAGAGGSLADAFNEGSGLLVYPGLALRDPPRYLTIGARQSRQWTESQQESAVLEYKPGCSLCSYPGEREYRVIFAYAYLPGSKDTGDGNLLSCGLRSNPVPLPPKP